MENNNLNNSDYNQPLFPGDDSFDVKRYISLFLSNWYWFAISLFFAFTIAYGINRYSEEVFSVSSSLLIKDESLGGYSGMEPIFPGSEIYKNQQNLKNEIGILKSFSLNRQVIDSLPEFQTEYIHIGRRRIAENKQYKMTPFKVVFDTLSRIRPGYKFSVILKGLNDFEIGVKGISDSWIMRNYGDTISEADFFQVPEPGFRFVIEKRDPLNYKYDENSSNRYFFQIWDLDALANMYRNKLQVTPIEEEATLVILSVAGNVAEQEIDYLNMLSKVYISRGLQEKNKAAGQTILFINSQLASILDSLRSAEDDLQEYRLKNQFIDISKEGSVIQANLEKYESERFSIELQKQYFQYLLGYLSERNKTGDIVSPSVMEINDPLLERLVSELVSMQQQKSQLELNLSSSMSVIRLMEDKINSNKEAIRQNIENSLKNLDISLTDIGGKISSIEAELIKLPETEKGLIRIQRKFDLNNTVYTYLLEKRAEASITRASNVPDNKKIDDAGLYNYITIRPKPMRNNLMALLFGLLIPMIMILLIDYLNNKVIDKKDIERITQAPVLGYISHNDYASETPVISKPSSTLSESFRSVRTALKYFDTGDGTPVVSITSTVSSEGKSFISVNLAAITALLGKRVLLVGLDLRKPKIPRSLEVENSTGMSTYLSGNSGFEEVIQKTKIENLYLATAGPVPPNPAELIESARMKEFINEARKKFDYIIIDTPPVAIVTDALLVAPHVDMNIFVVRQRYTSKNTLSLIQDFYQSRKLKNLSIIINDISLSGYYGYGLRYGATMSYGGYAYGYNFYGDYVYSRYGYKESSSEYYNDDDSESEQKI